MPSQTLAIETTGLTKHFGQRRAVDSITLAIQEGTVSHGLRNERHF